MNLDVGDYAPLSSLLSRKLNSDTSNIFTTLGNLCQSLKKQNKFLLVAIDEFGKILEHAANHNPEQELYFLQKMAEFANVPTRRIILLTTLHQNFSAYASKLTETQKNLTFLPLSCQIGGIRKHYCLLQLI